MLERKDEQLKVIYLFLLADGKKSSEEMSMFGEICKKYEIEKKEKNDVIRFCNEKLEEYKGEKNPVLSAINDVINTDHNVFSIMKGIKESKGMQISTLWNLMNLAFADEEFVPEEREIIDYLINYWNVDEKILYHLTDSLATLNELYKHKVWINKSIVDKSTRDELLKENRRSIENILKSIELTVEEVEMI